MPGNEYAYHYYSVHGISLRANRRLEDLTPNPTRCAPALSVWMGPMDELRARRADLDWPRLLEGCGGASQLAAWSQETAPGTVHIHRASGPLHLLVAVISDCGDSIEIGWSGPDHVAQTDLKRAAMTWLSGTLLCLALRLSGLIVLHGNAVRIDGRAVAWVAGKSAGKSTLAAAFVSAGHPLLTDDQIVVRPAGDGYGVAAGIPRLRLWADSLPAMTRAGSNCELRQPFGAPEKGYVRTEPAAAHGVDAAPTPLAAIYLLEPRNPLLAKPEIRTPAPGHRLHVLLSHRFGRRSLALSEARQRAEFLCLGDLARRVPVRLLRMPDRLAALPEVVRAVLADCRRG